MATADWSRKTSDAPEELRQLDALEAIADPEFQEILSHMHESADGSPPES